MRSTLNLAAKILDFTTLADLPMAGAASAHIQAVLDFYKTQAKHQQRKNFI